MQIRDQSFALKQMFPPDDPCAVDLLRLMSGYNDLALIVDWLESHRGVPEDFSEQSWAAGRFELQIRLLRSIMHETLIVLEEAEQSSAFKELEAQIGEDGRRALARLREVREGKDEFSKRMLLFTRNKVAYHYDHGQFKKGLQGLIKKAGDEGPAHIHFIEDRSGQEFYYFAVADCVRVEMTDGLTGQASIKELDALMDLTRSFGTFLEALLNIYTKVHQPSLDLSLRGSPESGSADIR